MNLFDSFSILKDVLTLKDDKNTTSKFQNKTKKFLQIQLQRIQNKYKNKR